MSLTQINKAGLDELALDHVFTIGASGSSAYTFQGEGLNGTVNNPTLYLTRGKTYRFENGSGGHPIRIQSTSGASGTAYNTGVTNNAGSGTVIVEVQHDAPDVLYYQCTSHAAMNGILYITGALADGGVTTAKIAADAVTGAKIADDAINSEHYTDGSIDTAHIADSQVTNAKLADNAVSTARIADGAVNANKLGSAVVTTAKIEDNAVTSAKIADEAVTLAKLPHGTSSNDGKFLRANNGADPTFETVSGTTINNNADNKIITGSGTANTLEAESLAQIDSGGDLWIGHAPTTHYDNRKAFFHQPTADETCYISITGPQGAGIVFGDSVGQSTGNYESIIWHRNSDDRLMITTDNGNKGIYIENGGDIEVIDGNIKLAAGHGIDFGATSNAGTSTPHEVFDDYEEGTFTPTVTGSSNNPTQTYANQTGHYTKIGEFCFVSVDLTFGSSGISGGSGEARLDNLPFTTKNVSNNYGVLVGVGYSPSWGPITPTSGYTNPNVTFINLMGIDEDTGTQFVQSSQVGNHTRLIAGFAYRTA